MEAWVTAAWTAVALLLGYLFFVFPRGRGAARRLGRRDPEEERAALEQRKQHMAHHLASFLGNGGEAMVTEHLAREAAEKVAREAEIAEDRSFREGQEREYAEQEAADRQRLKARRAAKEEAAAAAAAREEVEEEEELRQALSLSVELDSAARAGQRSAARLRRRRQFESEPAAEGAEAVRLCVRMPGGRRLVRSWALSAKIGELYDYVDAMSEDGELGEQGGEQQEQQQQQQQQQQPGFTLRTPYPARTYVERGLSLSEVGLDKAETLLVSLVD